MRLVVGLSALVAAAIVGSWWWLGMPFAMPSSPVGPGERLYCVSYAPFRGLQNPIDRSGIDPSQFEDDLARLAPLTDCVRTYSTELGLDQVPEIAQRHGLKVIQGVWLGRDRARNRIEIDTAVEIARRYPGTVRAIVAGNEVLLRGELSPSDLAGLIREVKSRVAIPVTYAEVWEFWLRNRDVADAVDFVTIHVLPYWEDIPIAADIAAEHVASIRRMVGDAFPGKDVFLGEVGWPSAGRMREGALPSPVNQARVIHGVLSAAKRDNFRANVIEAFDQPWKRQLEGTVGGHWGLLDGDSRRFKFTWGMPLSNHPLWPWQAAVGIALAAAVFGAARAAGRGASAAKAPTAAKWFGVAAMALGPGILIGWAIENVPLESLGLGGWAHSLAMVAVALFAPIAGAAALMRQIPLPAFAQVLARVQDRPADRLGLALGLAWIVLCVMATEVALGLAFDPRYRDFPFAPLGAAAVPFVVLALIGARAPGPRGAAETVMGAVLGASAVYIAFDEGFANWQAIWLCAVLFGLTLALLRPRAARGS
jgi:exo-beta-1,3-glucanase (GH17 family)